MPPSKQIVRHSRDPIAIPDRYIHFTAHLSLAHLLSFGVLNPRPLSILYLNAPHKAFHLIMDSR